MDRYATLDIEGQKIKLPIIEGTEGEKAVDISKLRAETSYITLDNGYGNTGSCESDITFIDGEKGILRYRGYTLEDVCANASFIETSYLLIHGELPNTTELENFSELLNQHSLLHEAIMHLSNHFPHDAHPMNVMGNLVNALSSFNENVDARSIQEDLDSSAAKLIAKIRTIAALVYRKSRGLPFIYPKSNLPYCENFLNMMFASPVTDYEVDKEMAEAMNVLLILHADHEQNCSTSTVRLVGSSQSNLYATIACGVSALWGPLHGGANQKVIEMLSTIHETGESMKNVIERAKNKNDDFKLSGFGHRVYKNFDPRANIIKDLCRKILLKRSDNDPLLNLAMELEDKVLEDDYFIERKLYPNVDFYSGLLYRAMGFPVNMFTPIFAIGRMPGWIAHWREMVSNPSGRIGRPRQIYTGSNERSYLPIDKR